MRVVPKSLQLYNKIKSLCDIINLKYPYEDRRFWCEGFYVDTVGRNEKAIEEYIKHQLDEDIAFDDNGC